MGSCFDNAPDRLGTNSLKWTLYPADVLPLWVADMDFPAPEPVRDALRRAIDHGVFGYELPTRRLREAVAARMQRLYGWEVSPEWVVATPGVVAGFGVATRSVCKPGDGVLVQPPVYPPFLKVAPNNEAVTQLAPLREVDGGPHVRYEIDWTIFANSIHSTAVKTALFLLCHPHNPTGQVYSTDELRRMAELCLEKEVTICSDEIHSELLLGTATHTPLAKLDPAIARQTITLVSPSKTFNQVGLFCGLAIIPDSRLRVSYRRVLEHQAMHVNSLGLIAAEVAFSGACDDWLKDLRDYLTANRNFIVEYVEKQLPGIRVTVPDASYLAWMDCREWIRNAGLTVSPYEFLLKHAKVALNPGEEFGTGGTNFVRLNFACPRSRLEEALRRIRNAVVGT